MLSAQKSIFCLKAFYFKNQGVWERIDGLDASTCIVDPHNPRFKYGSDRWVRYNDKVGLEYDGSQIPAEWFGWMHHKTDIPPTEQLNMRSE